MSKGVDDMNLKYMQTCMGQTMTALFACSDDDDFNIFATEITKKLCYHFCSDIYMHACNTTISCIFLLPGIGTP